MQKMKLSSYPLTANAEATTFDFFSHGPQGTIAKIIQFHLTETPNLYNLSFGDLNPTNGDMDDRSRSNNGDHEIVLATIVSAVIMFTVRNPNAWIYAKGSTLSRTRLYQMGIARYRERAIFEFHILAKTQHHWEEFNPGKNYLAFLVFRRKKNLNFHT
jgi:hypothetical protein